MKKENSILTGLAEAVEYANGNHSGSITHIFCQNCGREIKGQTFESQLKVSSVLCSPCKEEEDFELVWGCPPSAIFRDRK